MGRGMKEDGTPSPEKQERPVLDGHDGHPVKEARSASAPLPSSLTQDTELQDMSENQQKLAGAWQLATPPIASVSVPALHSQEQAEVSNARHHFHQEAVVPCTLTCSQLPGRVGVVDVLGHLM